MTAPVAAEPPGATVRARRLARSGRFCESWSTSVPQSGLLHLRDAASVSDDLSSPL